MATIWTASSEKHLPKADGVHALANRRVFLEGFAVSRTHEGKIQDLVIGPARDGQLLEVLIERTPPRDVLVFHVMPLRESTWKRAQEAVRARKAKEEG